MNSQNYLNAVLTVIAIALICNLFKDAPIIPSAHAQSSDDKPVKVELVNVDKYAFKYLRYSQDDSVPVRIKNDHSISGHACTSDPVDVRVIKDY